MPTYEGTILDTGGAVFNVLAYDADPTGATDSTAAVQSALDAAAASGGGTVLVPLGTYLVGSPGGGDTRASISMRSRVRLVIEGTLRAVQAAGVSWGAKAVIDARSVTDFTIEGSGTIDGQKAVHPTAKTHGIILATCSRAAIRGITIRDIPADASKGDGGDGILLGVDVMTLPYTATTDIKIEGVTIDGAERNGASVVSGNRVKFSGCVFRNNPNTNPGAGIDVEKDPTVPAPGDISVVDCDFVDLAGYGVAVIKGAYNVQVVSSRFRRCRYSITNRGADVVAALNIIEEARSHAFFVYNAASRTKLIGNIVRGSYNALERTAVMVYDATETEVTDNTFSNLYHPAITVDQRSTLDDPAIATTNRITIDRNTCIDCIASSQRAGLGVIHLVSNAADGLTRRILGARIARNRISDSRPAGSNAQYGIYASLADANDQLGWDVDRNDITGASNALLGVSTHSRTISAFATVTPGAIPANSDLDVTVTITGLAFNQGGSQVDTVLATPTAGLGNNISYTAFPSAANTLTVRFRNHTAGSLTPNSRVWSFMVFKH